MELSKNTILITGGTSGLGLELTNRFLSMGNTVIITGRNQAKFDETKKRISNNQGKLQYLPLANFRLDNQLFGSL